MPKVLVTDCWTRKGLSAVRSLGAAGLEVHAVSHKLLSPAIYSRHTKNSYLLSDPKKDKELFLKKIIELIAREKFDCLIPLEEASCVVFLENRGEIEHYTSLPFGSAASFALANNKWETYLLAEKLGIPAPKSFLPLNDADLAGILSLLSFPFIMKPVSSSGSRGVKKIKNEAEFRKYYSSTVKNYGRPMLQEYIPTQGQGVGVGSLVDSGETLVTFSYKRLREFPISGGPSTLRESTDDPMTKKYASNLLREINWHGIAMVEFKTDPRDGIPKLMEINPRFWGSMDLAFVSGVNFPYLLYLLSQKREIAQPEYKTGVRCRWLFPGDIAHFISNPERFNLKPSFFRFFDKNTYYDDFKKDDLPGNIAAVLCALLSIFDLETWKIGVFR